MTAFDKGEIRNHHNCHLILFFFTQISNERFGCERDTERTEIKRQASHGQLEQVNLTTKCSLVILDPDQRLLSIREEEFVPVSQRNGTAWLLAACEPPTQRGRRVMLFHV